MYLFSVLFNLYSNENENVIIREEFLRLMQVSECIFIQEFVQNLFSEVSFFFCLFNQLILLGLLNFQRDIISYEEFRTWLINHRDATSLSRWLLQKPCTVSLSNDLEMPTFYQTLAGVTHCKCYLLCTN